MPAMESREPMDSVFAVGGGSCGQTAAVSLTFDDGLETPCCDGLPACAVHSGSPNFPLPRPGPWLESWSDSAAHDQAQRPLR